MKIPTDDEGRVVRLNLRYFAKRQRDEGNYRGYVEAFADIFSPKLALSTAHGYLKHNSLPAEVAKKFAKVAGVPREMLHDPWARDCDDEGLDARSPHMSEIETKRWLEARVLTGGGDD